MIVKFKDEFEAQMVQRHVDAPQAAGAVAP